MNVLFSTGCQLIMGNNVNKELLRSVVREVTELVNVFTAIKSQLGNRFPEAAGSKEFPDVLPRLQSFERELNTGLSLEDGLTFLVWSVVCLGYPFGLPFWVPFSVWLYLWRRQ